MRGGSRSALCLGAFALSWVAVPLLGFGIYLLAAPHDLSPRLQNVARFPWSSQTDMYSSVYSFFSALLVGLVAVAFAEVGKFLLVAEGYRLLPVVVSAFQLVLICDAIRVISPDWWLGLLRWLAFRDSRRLSDSGSDPWAWPSLIAMLVVCCLVLVRRKEASQQ